MRKLMKNPRLLLALALALCLVLSVTAYVWHRHSAGEELPDIHREVKVRKVLEHPEEYPDLTVIVYDNANDYIKAVKRDEALEPEERNALAGAAMTKEGIRYLKLRMEVPVEKGYCVYPSFYLRCTWEDGQPGEILAVEKAFLDRLYQTTNWLGQPKEVINSFSGQLFHSIEVPPRRLYWNLYGDFYQEPEAPRKGFTLRLGMLRLELWANQTIDHMGYVCKTVTYDFG